MCSFVVDVLSSVELAGVLQLLQESGGLAAYGLMVLVLVLGTCGVPVPEEAVFASAGAMAATGRIAWPVAWLVGWSSIILLDLGLHTVGRLAGPGVRRSRLGRRIGRRRWAAMRLFVARRGVWAVVAARFVMGTRIAVFLLAGAMGMPRGRFLLVVATAGAVSVALPLALGYFLGTHLAALLAFLRAAHWVLAALVVAGLLLWWIVARRRARRDACSGTRGAP